MFPTLRSVARDPEGKVLLVGAFLVISIGTGVYMLLEGWSFVDSLYFSVVTLATVGFGDLHPTTDLAKLFTVGYILSGIGILAGFAAELTKHRQGQASLRGKLHTGQPPSVDPGELPADEDDAREPQS